jgi:hypothetical protein
VQLGCFVCVCQVDEIESSLGPESSHCRGMLMYEVFDPGG